MITARIVLIGLNYRTSPISVREKLSCSTVSSGRIADILGSNVTDNSYAGFVQELVLLSTCNRVEAYAALDAEVVDVEALMTTLLSDITGVGVDTFAGQYYCYTDQEAANHLLRVSAGLDSLILGEPQVLGQVTDAYMDAVDNRSIGPVLTELFRAAIHTGKRARSETTISQNSMSASTIAIAQAHKLLGAGVGHRYLVIGIGKMGQLALKRLRKADAAQIGVINRTYRRAADLVREDERMIAYRWEELPDALAAADIVISATGAPHIVISAEMINKVMISRPSRPLVLLDIAVPRDIEQDVRQIAGVHLYDADQLQHSLDGALAARQAEAPKVERIITEELDAFAVKVQALNVRPVIVRLRAKAERIRQEEVERTLHYLGDADPQTLEQLHFFSRSLINKLLHEPTVRLRSRAGNGEAATYAAVINDLFALEEQAAD